ncbi:MAG: ATP-dependent zinc metalloprotease FtsH [Oscillospiraceae bacterium]|nr:ATP-dependent zinc metalloprotease FtsH [Oscillospiraceae bacterium]
MKPQRNRTRDIGFYILILVLLACTVFTLLGGSEESDLSYAQVKDLFKQEKVQEFTYNGTKNILQMKVKDSESESGYKDVYYKMYSFSLFYEDMGELVEEQYDKGIIKDYQIEPVQSSWWIQLIPYVLFIGFMVFWVVMMNRLNGGGGAGGAAKFGKARTRLGSEEKNKKTFADVAGADEEKAELQELVEFLKNPRAFTQMGARIPKGVLLVGPPGTGKTLLAKAVAGEAGVQFLSISGSDFVELYVGVGASRVRDLFDQAKKVAPAIIFIDEIDAVGRQRGSGLGGGHDEREQTLNQLLVEMDGFGNNEGVIVMAATNRSDILDNALLRPGRFDRQVYVGLPDIKGREEILKIHSRGKPLAEDVSLKSIAKGTPGFSGADLENLMNEAALLAVRRRHRFITMEDCDEAILKVEMGPEKKSHKISDKAKRLTAYHESGHAIAAKYLEHVDPVHYITIIPRGMAGGFTLFRPEEDAENFTSKSQMFERIVTGLGGRIAEKLFLDDISTGASGDIQQASSIARSMVMRYGMSDKLGPILYDSSDHSIFIGRDFGTTKSYSEETAAIIDEEVKRIFDEAAALCEKILTEHRETLIGVAEYLLENESMDRETFDYYCEHGVFPEPKPAPAMQDDTIERPARKIARFDDAPENDASAGMADEPDDQDKNN